MATQEFYIRSATETEARGPFTVEQLVSLADAGQVTAETLYYDATTEKWLIIGDNEEVKSLVFPEKKRLAIKKEVRVTALNKEADAQETINVHDMLAAAEGRTADTRDKGAYMAMAQRCAKLGLWGCILMLLAAATAELLPSIDLLSDFKVEGLVKSPLVILGAIDLFLAVMLILGVVAVYPFVRFRAMFGLGFLGFLFWTQNQQTPLLAAVAGAVGLYVSTVFVTYLPLAIGLILGFAGMGGLAYLLIT
jgi:hypothetical protein